MGVREQIGGAVGFKVAAATALAIVASSSAPGYARIAATSGGQIYFSDEMDFEDNDKWNTNFLTSGFRFCSTESDGFMDGPGEWIEVSQTPCHGYTQPAPYGTAEWGGGYLQLTADDRRTFPFLWAGPPSRPSPFPERGNFVFEMRVGYPAGLSGNGTGIVAVTTNDFSRTELPFGKGAVLILNGNEDAVRLEAPGVNCVLDENSREDEHDYRLEFVDGEYITYVDGKKEGSGSAATRPTTIWAGSPIFNWWEPKGSDWSGFEMQSVKVTVPQMYLSSLETRPKLPKESPVDHTIEIELENLEAGEEVEMEVFEVRDSGGHEDDKHNPSNGRPLGGFAASRGASNFANPFSVTADASGEATLYYRAPEIGGDVIIEATSLDDDHRVGRADVAIRVEGLELLDTDDDYYRKVGGTCEHHGPSDKSLATVPQDCRTPDNNHWGTQDLIDVTVEIAEEFKISNSGKVLRINDMSLPYGGRFDIAGKWTTGSHKMEYGHPLGRSVDIGHDAWDLNSSKRVNSKKQIQNAIEWVIGQGTERDESKDPFASGTYFDEQKDVHFHVMK